MAQDESCIGAHLGERAPRGADDTDAMVAAAPAAAAAASDPAAHDSAARRPDAGSTGRAVGERNPEEVEGDPEMDLNGDEDGVSVASDASEGTGDCGQGSHAVESDGRGPGGGDGEADHDENSGSAGASDAGEDDVQGTNAVSRDSTRGSEAADGSGLDSARSGTDAYEAFMDGAADPLRRHYQRCASDMEEVCVCLASSNCQPKVCHMS